MINIVQRLKEDLTVIELIKLLKSAPEDLTGMGLYTLIPADTLSTASKASLETISYCKEHDFIRVEKLGNKCFEFRLTGKGLAFLNSQS